MISSLINFTKSHPGSMFSVYMCAYFQAMCAYFQANLKESYLTSVKHILSYLTSTSLMGLTIQKRLILLWLDTLILILLVVNWIKKVLSIRKLVEGLRIFVYDIPCKTFVLTLFIKISLLQN